VHVLKSRSLSPLLATLVLIAVMFSASIIYYAQISDLLFGHYDHVEIKVLSLQMYMFSDKMYFSASVKNTGNKPIIGIIISGVDDNGKSFSLALPPIEPDETAENSLIIPLGVSNLALDASGRNNHVVIHGSPDWIAGRSGGGIDFADGQTSQFLDVPHVTLNGLTDYTIAFWAYGGGGGEYIISGSDGHNHNYMLLKGPTDSGWHFYVWRRGGGYGTHAYRDLALYDSLIYSNPGSPINLAPGGLIIAQEQDSLGGGFEEIQAFSGAIDEIYFYGRALSDEEMALLFNSIIVTDGLTLFLTLDECTFEPYSFTSGESYSLDITAYTSDRDVYTKMVTVVCA